LESLEGTSGSLA